MNRPADKIPARRSSRRLRLGILIFAALLTGGAFWLRPWLSPEPRFDGKTVREWVRWAEKTQSPPPAFRNPSANIQTTYFEWEQQRRRVIERLVQLGTNVAPYMVDWLLESESSMERGSLWIRRHLPVLAGWLPGPRNRNGQWATASQVLVRLGPSATGEVPRLARSLNRRDASLQFRAITVLSGIGPASATASIAVAQQLVATNARLNTAITQAIARMGPPASNASPYLLSGLGAGWLPPDEAMAALWPIGCPAEKIVPALKRCVMNSNHGDYALTLLVAIGT
jgi:hypothetical protein